MRSIALNAVLAALFAGVVAIPAAAAERERGINARQGMQQNRIQQGVRQGDLTRGEARRLQSEARDIRREERTFRADGDVSRGERRHLQGDLNRMSRDIRHQRNDGERRFGHRGDERRADFRGRGHAYGRHGDDRRFWARGAEQRFGRHDDHPRFGNQWGHRSPASGMNRMQAQQHGRIMQGIRSGELTRPEARRLMGEQRMIARQERAYLADGRLSGWERRDLYGDLRDANRHIYNQTHDAQTRR
ncbi:MAG TPA: hypothetical protein VD839_08470 [Burkholderiales bacterium]|nr:hypothetical protein [Burkholderiales bacterium]